MAQGVRTDYGSEELVGLKPVAYARQLTATTKTAKVTAGL
jgi:hypothetical protein